MTLIAMTAGKGAPGVTTAAAALAAVWPRQAVLADCDPAGGDVALRLPAADGGPLRRDQGLLALAARLRTDSAGAVGYANHLQHAVGGLPVLTGVAGPGQAAALGPLWAALARSLAAGAGEGVDTFADCGRYQPGDPTEPVLAAADAVLVVTRPTVEGLTHLLTALDALARSTSAPLGVIVIDDARQSKVGEVADALADAGSPVTRVIGTLAFDPIGAAGMCGVPTRRLDRTALVVSARRLSTAVVRMIAARRPAPSDAGAIAAVVADATYETARPFAGAPPTGGSMPGEAAQATVGLTGQAL
jgi:MinD-like ATPase involved in chromosome partitioning or flagellar assembly